MPRALKVYRTAIGFHDAFVATTSQKEALKAWGTDADLFARGMAEMVTDPKLTGEPLQKPGKVVKRPRGSAAEHLASVSPNIATGRKKAQSPSAPTAGATYSTPRPSRRRLDAAERKLSKAEDSQRKQLDEIDGQIAALNRNRKELREKVAHEITRLERVRDAAQEAYDQAMGDWRRNS